MKVTTAWCTVLPYLHLLLISRFLPSNLTTYTTLVIYYLFICCKYEVAGSLRIMIALSSLYRSSHRSSSAKTCPSIPKYVSIYMISSGWFTCSYPTRVFMQSIISYESKWMKFMTFYNLITRRPSRTHGRSAYSV